MKQPRPAGGCRPAASTATPSLLATLVLATLIAATLPGQPAAAGEFTKQVTLHGKDLLLTDLIGEIDLEQAGGDDFEVEVRVRGKDASAELIDIKVEEGRQAKLMIQFPVEDERRYVYPRMGRGSKTTISAERGSGQDPSWWEKLVLSMSGERIKISGSGSGLEVWADVTVKVPVGCRADIMLGVGEIIARDLEADLTLDTESGPVTARHLQGDLVADTGSGSVEAKGITGEMSIDTGSGQVVMADCRGKKIAVDTGSGSVDAADIDCQELLIDTGSGGVSARGIKAHGAKIDTGSGSVVLALDRMGTGRFLIDTGSGGIDLRLPQDASARITADTGSGGITLDIENVRVERRERDYIAFGVGDEGAQVSLEAGSGSIRIHR
jgi:hypothetical protein